MPCAISGPSTAARRGSGRPSGIAISPSTERLCHQLMCYSPLTKQPGWGRRMILPFHRQVRHLQNLVSARPWPSAASPQTSSALRIQRRRTNRGRSPGYGICKQRLNRRARRPRGSPQTEERQGIRSGWGRARFVTEAVGPTAGPSQISRNQPPVQEILGHLTRWLLGPRLCHDAAAR